MIAVSESEKVTRNARHIDIYYYHIWNLIEKKIIVISHILTNKITVNNLTKTLLSNKFKEFIELIEVSKIKIKFSNITKILINAIMTTFSCKIKVKINETFIKIFIKILSKIFNKNYVTFNNFQNKIKVNWWIMSLIDETIYLVNTICEMMTNLHMMCQVYTLWCWQISIQA